MNRNFIRRDVFGQIAGVVIAILVITSAAYLWRIPQNFGTGAVLAVYSISLFLMILSARIVFRVIVRRGYRQYNRLTPMPFFLQLLIWGLFFAFPCIYNPIDWGWMQSEISLAIPVLGTIGWTSVWFGLVALIGSMIWLGVPRSMGQNGKKLVTTGPYRLTRNPQLIGSAILIIGCVLLWPSWYALGWVTLFAAMTQMMVLSEEEHLRKVFGEEYARYCKNVPRYFKLPWN